MFLSTSQSHRLSLGLGTKKPLSTCLLNRYTEEREGGKERGRKKRKRKREREKGRKNESKPRREGKKSPHYHVLVYLQDDST